MSLHLNTAHPLKEADGTIYNLGSKFGKRSSYVVFKVPPAAGMLEEGPWYILLILPSVDFAC